MADYNSRLPVRTEDNGDVVAKIVDFTTNTIGLKVESDGHINVHLYDEAGVAFSPTNPLPVEFFENLNETYDYDTASSVAVNATSSHTYTAPANFKLHEIIATASGKIKIEVQIGTSTVFVGFNSTANPNIHYRFDKGINASSTTITVIRTNLDKQAQDVYSTIIGAVY